eukprot:TRINITY_DN3103_c1_g4_i1.p1 TRINITY_DN3103_c1_g4~~TRINITY_DN3103_c1_g4_i1.p1  ORF type:complete len:714 (+),score=177.56 TRINITY_DN3103_c1_g4_i1:80-2143(+)
MRRAAAAACCALAAASPTGSPVADSAVAPPPTSAPYTPATPSRPPQVPPQPPPTPPARPPPPPPPSAPDERTPFVQIAAFVTSPQGAALAMALDTTCSADGPLRDLPFALHPTRLTIGGDPYVGCLFGNAIIVAVAAVLCSAVQWAVGRRRPPPLPAPPPQQPAPGAPGGPPSAPRTPTRTPRSSNGSGPLLEEPIKLGAPPAAAPTPAPAPAAGAGAGDGKRMQLQHLPPWGQRLLPLLRGSGVLDPAALTRYPGTAVWVLLVLYQGCAFSALRIACTSSGGRQICGIIAATVLVAAPAVVSLQLRDGVGNGLARVRDWDSRLHGIKSEAELREPAEPGGPPRRPWDKERLRRVLLCGLFGSGEWVSRRREPHWALRWWVCRDYKASGASHGLAAQFAAMWLLGLSFAPRTPTWLHCAHVRVAAAGVHLGLLSYLAGALPLRVPREALLTAAQLIMQTAALLVIAVGMYREADRLEPDPTTSTLSPAGNTTRSPTEALEPYDVADPVAHGLLHTACGLLLARLLGGLAADAWLAVKGFRSDLQIKEWAEADAEAAEKDAAAREGKTATTFGNLGTTGLHSLTLQSSQLSLLTPHGSIAVGGSASPMHELESMLRSPMVKSGGGAETVPSDTYTGTLLPAIREMERQPLAPSATAASMSPSQTGRSGPATFRSKRRGGDVSTAVARF